MERMPALSIDEALATRLHRRSDASRWGVSVAQFTEVLEGSVRRAFEGRSPGRAEIERYLEGLHLADLAIAAACADGSEAAWEHVVGEYRPVLYRAAQAIDPSGGARDLADSLYAELYGLDVRAGVRQSLFRYFHGRSTLATWLRTVLAQRHVDRLRAARRFEPLDEEEDAGLRAAASGPPDPDRQRLIALLHRALAETLHALGARDRLRLTLYYAQQLTLAEIGRLTREHEATVSRQLARTRRATRLEVERRLRVQSGLSDEVIRRCFEYATEDPGPLDLDELLDGDRRKIAE
jgi:RNA polymerase sigma-70 factor (ECF subfamily)